jgi:phage shock protein C
VLTGLAGGLGDYFNVDPTIIRVVLVLLEFATAGLLIIGYLIVSLFVPKEPAAKS